ncbi:MAG: glycolate oxidase subunit GlcF [Defluviicoccus sp.]|nr:glycolate oxidase subunit GlcF [Defluviicoccus sp.]MDE0278513.1 glycolate oxidase subunit GlcF [Defluviicoccus sp.]
MQTRFTDEQRADPDIAAAEGILRGCVHCGFCSATCPTYTLLGDELDSPRGRIYLMKEMLETGEAPSAKVVGHIDRCLSCLSCMTTCPSGVHYMHLVDLARKRIAETFRRPLADRLVRALLLAAMPSPARFGWAVRLGRLAQPFAGLLPGPLGRMLRMVPSAPAGRPLPDGAVYPAEGERRFRVALLAGCVQQVLDDGINAATIRLLTRFGCEVVVARGAGCCGALAHHMGKEAPALEAARRNIRAWQSEIAGEGLDAVVSNTSGCGAMLKDYGYLLRDDPELAETAAALAGLTCDISELLQRIGPGPATPPEPLSIAYHSACALQHGQKIETGPVELLREAGFAVSLPAEGHLCCGSAGTYNILQPALADRLRDRKAGHLEALGADAIAAGNIGCMVQLGDATGTPVVHTVELLDWAHGGPRPRGLGGRTG